MMVNRKINLGILFGGRSGEHDVSLMSARAVLNAIDPAKYAVTQIGITRQGDWFSGENVLESLLAGETETLPPVAPGMVTLIFCPSGSKPPKRSRAA